MSDLSLAEEEAELSLADMEEMQFLMWLSFLRSQQHGDFLQAESDGRTVFELNRHGAANLVLGRTESGDLYLGVAPSVGTWFPHLAWQRAIITNKAICLQVVVEGNDMELVVPLLPMVYEMLPPNLTKLELSALSFAGEASNDAQPYERVSTRVVACEHKGGN